MNSTIALNVQKRINALDATSIISIVLALISYSSFLLMTVCLMTCLLCQALVFRSYFKYIHNAFQIAKRVLFIVGIFATLLALLVYNNLI